MVARIGKTGMWLGIALLALAAAASRLEAEVPAKPAQYIREHYAKHTVRIPMRDGVRLFTVVYAPKDPSREVSDPAHRTPTASAPTASDLVRDSLGPIAHFVRGRLHLRLPGRARPLHVRGRVRQHAAALAEQGRAEGHRREHRHLRHHRLAGQERAEQQRQGRPVGHLVPRLLRGGRHDRRPPRAQGRLAAGADRRLVLRRLPPPRRLLPAARLQLLRRLRPAAAGADDERRQPLRPRHAGRLPVLPRPRPAQERQREATSRTEIAFWNDADRAPQLRRVLAGAQPPAAPEEGRAGGDDRRRLVRRRGPLRRASRRTRPSRSRTPASSTSWSWGRGRTAAGRAATATSLGNVHFGANTVGVLSRRTSSCRSSTTSSRARASTACPRRTSSRRARTAGGSSTTGRRRTCSKQTLYFRGRRPAVVRSRRREDEDAYDEYVSDPAKPVPFTEADRHRHDARVHDRRPALRLAPARRAGLPDGRR